MTAIATTISSTNRDVWLDARRRYLGASEFPAILGLDPYSCALDIYMRKRGMAAEREMSEAMEAGMELEEPVLRWYGKRIGQPVQHNTLLHLSAEYSWLACTPDGRLRDGTPIQVKCSGRTSAWDEQIPDHVYVQIQAEMLCLGTQRAVALALVSGWGGLSLKPYDVGRDEQVIAQIVAAGNDMSRRIADGDPPDPDGSKAATDALRQMFPEEVADSTKMLDIGAAEATVELADVEAQLKKLENERERLRNVIKLQLGAAERGVLPGGGTWSWRTQSRAGYTVEPSSSRVLRFSKPKKGSR